MRTLLHSLVAAVMFGSVVYAEVRVTPLGEAPQSYRPAEFRVELGKTYDNPFDPKQIAVDAVITAPDGKRYRLPAFWYEDVKVQLGEGGRATVQPGEKFWMVRMCPTAPGDYSVIVEAKDAAGVQRSGALRFSAAASPEARGFVRIAPNRRYHQFDTGQPLFLVGLNIGWGSAGRWADEYDRWFGDLAKAGGNYARIWMADFRWNLETTATGLKRYDTGAAKFYDEVLSSAQKHGVRVMMTFVNHRLLINSDMWGAAPWPNNPYNAAKGGPATRPVDFFTHVDAREAFKNRIRYMVARYAAYPGLGWWELFNEQEHAGLGTQLEWNKEMSEYVEELDPYDRPVTTSGAGLSDEVWKLKSMGFPQYHYYGDDTTVDLISPMVQGAREVAGFGKPFLIGEHGISYKRSDANFDEAGKATEMHNGLWVGMMVGAAGGGALWYWDNYVAPKNLWHIYTPFAKFAQQIDWVQARFEPLADLTPQRSNAGEQFTDAVVTATQDWGKSHGEVITLQATGQTDKPLSKFLYGPAKAAERTASTLKVRMQEAGDIRIHVGMVSDVGIIRVTVDGKPVRDVMLSALPGAPEIGETKLFGEGGPYQAQVNKVYSVPLAAGEHTVKLENIAGDWIRINSVAFSKALSSRFAHVRALGIRDEKRGETLVWIYDRRSNWKNDQEGKQPERIEDAEVVVPAGEGEVEVTWWDTWSGKVIHQQTMRTAEGKLKLVAPPFERDVAARVVR